MNAIQTLQGKPRKEHRALLKLFEYKNSSTWPSFNVNQLQNCILLDPSFPGYREQKEFVEIAIATPDFAFLEGPPGSGKTKAICELILQTIKNNQRVLLCGSTNPAVDNVLEAIMDRDDVIAVRIGEESSRQISPVVKPLLLKNRKQTERNFLLEKLRALGQSRNPGQQYFLDVLESDQGESEIEKAILENANLVCGTVMGILNHPDIAEERSSPRAVFDLLIIDEASKTTFQEFIVPAMYCKKWIIVGDIKQLSPFVEDVAVRRTIDGMLSEEEKQICRDIFCCWKYPDFTLVIAVESESIRNNYLAQIRSFNLEYVEISENNNFTHEWLSTQIFIGKPANILRHLDILPTDAIVRGINTNLKYTKSYAYWQKYKEFEMTSKKKKGNFGEQVAWRLIRLYQLRFSEGDRIRQELEADINRLMPTWLDQNKQVELKNKILNLKKVAFPSILECLQKGLQDYENLEQNKQTNLKNGLNPDVWSLRHRPLKYQHRMHPEISAFPRDQIYNRNVSIQERKLIDNPQMEQLRTWGYRKYAKRSIWINIPERNNNDININQKEAYRLLEELRFFVDRFASIERRRDNKLWEIAILAFHSNQEDFLRSIINPIFRKPASEQEFELRSKNVQIKICTVDRFQGHEADIVYLSFVKSNSVGFLNSINRLNVALTRARYQLVMIGNQSFFQRQEDSPILRELAQLDADRDTTR